MTITIKSILLVLFLTPAITLSSGTEKPKKNSAKNSIAHMKKFIKAADDGEKLEDALKKFAKPGVDFDNLDFYMFHSLKFVGKAKGNCFRISAVTSDKPRHYVICWKGKKIVKVKDLGFK